MSRKVVITGMGIYSCLGTDLDSVKDSLWNGKSGIIFDPERKAMGYRSALTGFVPEPDLKSTLSRAQRAFLPTHGAYAYVATDQAFKMAGINMDYLENNSVGILYGGDSTAEPTYQSICTMVEKGDTMRCGSGAIFKSMNSTVTMNLSCLFKLRGINMTVSAACASGSHAIGLGYLLIKEGLEDCIVCGGAQEINKYVVGSFDGIGAFSTRENEPEKASRPFDRDRDGLVPSGGAATLILESEESALKRGANIIAEVVGYGFSSNGDHISTPNVAGPAQSLRNCFRNSGIDPSQIGYINAHATSTPVGDKNEALAIAEVFGKDMPPVTSTKGQTGHEMWMAGASEAIYSILMMKNGFIAPSLNFENPDQDTALLNIPTKRIDTEFNMFLSNSFGFGGTNSTLIIKNR